MTMKEDFDTAMAGHEYFWSENKDLQSKIWFSSGGYRMTIVKFYLELSRSKSGKTVTLHEIRADKLGDSDGLAWPLADILMTGPGQGEFKKRIRRDGWIDLDGGARPWDGRPKHYDYND